MLNRRRYIIIYLVSIALVIASICVYLTQLSSTVNQNLMSTVDEISRHDVESIEGSLDNAYVRLGSVAKRMEVYDVHTLEEVQEQLNLESASSALFNAIYLLDSQGYLYSSSMVRFDPDEHAYDEILSDGREKFVMLYDDANGRLETTKESLIYGIRTDGMNIGGRDFVAMIGRSDLSIIRDQLLIESFDSQGISSVVNDKGYYIVSASPATDLAGRNNFYDMLESGRLEDGVTIEEVRRNISEGESFVINCVTADDERLVLSFAPVEGTNWSFIMAVPTSVFDQRFAPFITMTAGMLVAVVLVLFIMMIVIYNFMKRSVQASAESAARAEFLSNMSHEIRTPLNGIIGLNHLMENNLDDEAAMRGYVKKLGNAAKYLLSLVNDILDVSKLQAGKVELAEEPFDLRVTIDNVCDMQREPMLEKGIKFVTEADNLSYPYLIGDELRVSQVLMNILSNAVKFTPSEGTITITTNQILTVSTEMVATTISIADTGCGMTPEFCEHIFDAFSQERNKISGSQKGTGLGMAISHMLVSQMGGRLSVVSELGSGSCFTVQISMPFDHARLASMPERISGATPVPADRLQGMHAQGASDAASSQGSNAAKLSDVSVKLLIAEDNDLNAEIIVSILEKQGYETTLVANGEEAIRAFEASEEGEFAAILMDAQMPVMDGYEAAKEIRKLNRDDAKNVRIFACTASTFAEDRNRALESGMDDFLAKPLDVPVMLRKLEAVKASLVSAE